MNKQQFIFSKRGYFLMNQINITEEFITRLREL